jgi:metal-responsive CopG/Arc/MetJ family transcriptional regulator
MQTIQVVLEEELLQAADRAARRARQNRSALIREALRQHLQRIEAREREARDREGYRKQPQTGNDFLEWERGAAWPPE